MPAMARILFLLIVGLALGYCVGFRDATQHRTHIVERAIDKIGTYRTRVASDVDRLYERIAR